MQYPYLKDTPKIMICHNNSALCAYEIIGDSIKKYEIKKFTFILIKNDGKNIQINCSDSYFNSDIKEVLTNEIQNENDLTTGYFTDIEIIDNLTKEKAIIRRKTYLTNLRI